MKKIAVMGAGGIGGTLGGYITKGGEDVTLIDSWKEHVEAMRKNGLRITGSRGDVTIKVKALHTSELSQLEKKIDILFVAVKSYDTEKMLKLIKPYLNKDAWVVSCQNGINEDIIIPIIGDKNVVPCVVTFGGELPEPGHVHQPTKTGVGFTIGELDGKTTPRVKEIARILSLCFETRITDNIMLSRWNKLSNNSMDNSLAAITRTRIPVLIKMDKTRRVMGRIAYEIITVAAALGYKLEKVAGIDSQLWLKAAKEWQPEIDNLLMDHAAEYANNTPSTLQDALKGRQLETEHLNGYVAKKGKEVGVPTPVNAKLNELAKKHNEGKLPLGVEHIDTLLKA